MIDETILTAACRAAGLDHHKANLLRAGENTLYRLPGSVIVRIARPGQHQAAAREVRVARWLARVGVPAVQALPIEQPVVVDDRAVTFWHELPDHTPATPAQIAAVLRHLHAQPLPTDIELGELSPFVRVAERITAATTLEPEDRAWLLDRLTGLRQRWNDLPDGLPSCVVHGDAWYGNVVVTPDGTVVLLDLERCSIGRPEWDLTSTAIKHTSLGTVTDTEYTQFCQAYGGYDVTTWPGYPTMRDVRELRMTTYAAQLAVCNSAARTEARHRVDCLRGRNGPRPWTWTAVP